MGQIFDKKEYSDGSNIWQRRSELHRAAGYYSHTEVGFNVVLLKLIALAKTKTHTEVGFHLVLLKLLSSAKHCLDKMKEKWRGKWWWIAMKITFTLAYRYVIFSALWMLKYDNNRLGQLTTFTHCIFLQTYSHFGSVSRESCRCNVCVRYSSIIFYFFCLRYLPIISLIFFVSDISLSLFWYFWRPKKILMAKHQLHYLFISPASTTLIVFVMITLILFGVLRIFDPARVETFWKLTKTLSLEAILHHHHVRPGDPDEHGDRPGLCPALCHGRSQGRR